MTGAILIEVPSCSISRRRRRKETGARGPPRTPAPTAAQPTGRVPPLVSGLPDFTALVEHYGPAVVNVQVTEGRARTRGTEGPDQNDPFGDFFRRWGLPGQGGGQVQPRNSPPSRGVGSGFVVTPDGYIMTNAHVVRDASEVVVKMTDRREYTAKVVGIDDRTDVAVIKIDAKNLPTVRIGDPANLRISTEKSSRFHGFR